MPDGIDPTSTGSGSEPEVTLAEGRLLRRVRLSLTFWSAAITVSVIVAIGLALFLAVDRTLTATGTAQLVARADTLTGGRPDPDTLPEGGFIFGGPGSGTFTLVASADGQVLAGGGRGPSRMPDGLPLMPAIQAVVAGSPQDVRNTLIEGDTPVRVLTEGVLYHGRTVYLQVVGDRTAEVRTLTVLVVVLVLGGLVALLVATGAGAVFASRALVPIRHSLVTQREALRRQREFAADASHELRTPLTVIRASVDDLDRHRSEPVESVGSALADIRFEVDHVTALVDDLLLLARSDSGALELERVPVDLGDVATDAASSLAKVASDRGVAIHIDPAPTEVTGDPGRLRQVVTILVDNAIRHAPAGSSVTVSVRPEGPTGALVVDDEGPGMRPEDLPRVFDRFFRAPGAGGDGTGLGLAIAAWIVEHHTGRIEASNRPSGGARFTVQLPLTRASGGVTTTRGPGPTPA